MLQVSCVVLRLRGGVLDCVELCCGGVVSYVVEPFCLVVCCSSLCSVVL